MEDKLCLRNYNFAIISKLSWVHWVHCWIILENSTVCSWGGRWKWLRPNVFWHHGVWQTTLHPTVIELVDTVAALCCQQIADERPLDCKSLQFALSCDRLVIVSPLLCVLMATDTTTWEHRVTRLTIIQLTLQLPHQVLLQVDMKKNIYIAIGIGIWPKLGLRNLSLVDFGLFSVHSHLSPKFPGGDSGGQITESPISDLSL